MRARRARLLAASAALATAWIAVPHAVPLYDGLGVPDEPYRYVTPPAGYQKTPPPSSSTTTLPAANGASTGDGLYATTKEQSPQFGVFISTGSIATPPTAKSVTITITQQAPTDKTPGGPVDGNVYQVSLLADGAPTAKLAAAAQDSLVTLIRATSAKVSDATIYYKAAGGRWTALPSQRGGTDSFQAYFQGAGQYAVVAGGAGGSSSSSHQGLIIVLLALVVLAMVGAIVLIRLSRRTTPDP